MRRRLYNYVNLFAADPELLEYGIQGLTSIITGCAYSNEPFFTDEQIAEMVNCLLEEAEKLPVDLEHQKTLVIYSDGLSTIFDVLSDLMNGHVGQILGIANRMIYAPNENIQLKGIDLLMNIGDPADEFEMTEDDLAKFQTTLFSMCSIFGQ